jgi:hypothetical protein
MKTCIIILCMLAISLSASSSNEPRTAAALVESTSIGLQAAAASAGEISAEISPPAILEAMKKVADWQLTQPPRHALNDWTYGTLYASVMALGAVADSSNYYEAMRKTGKMLLWRPGRRRYDADDHCVCQMNLELYLKYRDPAMLRPTRKRFDNILANRRTSDLHANAEDSRDRGASAGRRAVAREPARSGLLPAQGNERIGFFHLRLRVGHQQWVAGPRDV